MMMMKVLTEGGERKREEVMLLETFILSSPVGCLGSKRGLRNFRKNVYAPVFDEGVCLTYKIESKTK